MVGQYQTVDFTGSINRNKGKQICFQSVFGRNKTAVSHTMTAFIGIYRCFGWHGAGIPDGVTIFDIVILSVGINRQCIVTVTGDTQQFCIFIEAVSAAGIGNKGEETFCAQIVDPWEWCSRGGNDIFSGFIIKMTEFHNYKPPSYK